MLPILLFWLFALAVFLLNANLYAQTTLKKVRMGIQSTSIRFLPFHVAYHKGFYHEQGIDVEMIFMSTHAVNKHLRLESGRDVTVVPLRGNRLTVLGAAPHGESSASHGSRIATTDYLGLSCR